MDRGLPDVKNNRGAPRFTRNRPPVRRDETRLARVPRFTRNRPPVKLPLTLVN